MGGNSPGSKNEIQKWKPWFRKSTMKMKTAKAKPKTITMKNQSHNTLAQDTNTTL